MSVYSGFATRHQQTKYNQYVQTLVTALLRRMLKFYAGQPCDQSKFKELINALYQRMSKLQQGKFMPPKYSQHLYSAILKLESLENKSVFNQQFLELQQAQKPVGETDSLSAVRGPMERGDIKSAFKSELERFKKKSYSISSVPQEVVPRKFKTVENPALGTPRQEEHQYEHNYINIKAKIRGNSCPDKIFVNRSSKMTRKDLSRAKEQYELAKELLRMPKLESFFQNKTTENSPREDLKKSILRRQPYARKKNKMI